MVMVDEKRVVLLGKGELVVIIQRVASEEERTA
jgi:hypothetical protein